MVVGQKKMAHNQIMPAVAQMWFMVVSFSLYQIEIYANVNAPINFRLQQIESNYPPICLEFCFRVNEMENRICHHDMAHNKEEYPKFLAKLKWLQHVLSID